MKARSILRLLTLTSWLPLAACAHSDGEEKNAENGANPAANATGEGTNNINANETGLDGNSAKGNNANSGNDEADLLGNDSGGDEDFDDDSDAVAANGQPAAAPGNIFEDDVAAETVAPDPTANAVMPSQDNGIDAFKETAIEGNTFKNDSSNLALNTHPIETQPEPIAPPVQTPMPAPAPVPVAQTAAPAPLPAAIAHDVESTPSILHYVGMKTNDVHKLIEIHILTKGRPEYEVFEQANRIHQNELIIRFHRTTLRKKLHWDVDSSEFRSPVAYIRMRSRPADGSVDLILTHRDNVQPLFYEKDGSFLLTYAIPDRYFSGADKEARKVKDKAQYLGKDQEALKPEAVAARLPSVGFPRFLAQFNSTAQLQPIRNVLSSGKQPPSMRDGLPASFDRRIKRELRSGYILERKTLVGVAQDDLESDFPMSELTTPSVVKKNAAKPAVKPTPKGLPQTGFKLAAAKKNTGDAFEDPGLSGADADPFAEGAKAPAEKPPVGNEVTVPPSDAAAQFESGEGPISGNPTNVKMGTQAPQDLEGEESTTKPTKFTGKPIFMEFYESELSLILKGFAEETGNNFVFSEETGKMLVSVNFKGVPWDEALKAILETYNLGMVRIGQNVVRVDKIAALTQYMQELEKAKQFESRRIPTKVMVFRLNNAVSKDVKDRLTALLAKDIDIDPRIKMSDDLRTNTVIIEAPEFILAKSRAIIERLDLETPQVEIVSRIVEVQKINSDFLGFAWGNNLNFDPGRALGFGTLNFPNSASSNFSVDPGVRAQSTLPGTGRFRFGSLNKFIDLDLLLRLEETKSTVNVLQSNRVLVLDGQKASILAGSSQFFLPAAGGSVINPAAGAGGTPPGLAEITFDLSLAVTPQVTALGNVIMNLAIVSDTPADPKGQTLASKNTRKLETQMVRASGDTGVIGGIYDTKKTQVVKGVPFLSDLPIIGALFRSTNNSESQTELLIMVTPTIISGPSDPKADPASSAFIDNKPSISKAKPNKTEKAQ